MTTTRHMLLPPFLAEIPPWYAPWLAGAWGFASAVVVAIVGYFLNRLAKRQEKNDSRRERREEGDASVEVAHIHSLDDLRRQWERSEAKNDARVGLLENKVSILTNAYYQLFNVTTLLQQSWRTMKARLKRADPTFDPDEFPDVDGLLADLSPAKVFAPLHQPASITVFSSPTNPKKTTTVIRTGGEPPAQD